MLQCVECRRKPGIRQPRRHHTRLRRPPGVKRFRHRSEIRYDSGTLRSANGNCLRGLLRVQSAKRCACRSRADCSEYAGGMPPLVVLLILVPPRQFAPSLVTRGVGCHHPLTRRIKRFRFGENRRHQNRTRVTALCDIVEIQRVRRSAVDEGGLRRAGRPLAEKKPRFFAPRLERLQQQTHRRLVAARQHHAAAIRKPHVNDGQGIRGQFVHAQISNETPQTPCEFNRHVMTLLRWTCRRAIPFPWVNASAGASSCPFHWTSYFASTPPSTTTIWPVM